MRERLVDLGTSLATALLLGGLVAAPFLLAHGLLGVHLLRPAGLWLLLLALPLLLLHVLKTTRPRRRVGSVLFWRGVAQEQRAAHPFKRLRRSLGLLLQLFALASVAWAASRPVVEATLGDEGLARVIVIDTSASMLTREKGGATRFEQAREAALGLVASLGPDDAATVIACDRTAWIVVPWTTDRAALTAGLEELRPRHTGTALDEGLLLAAAAGGPERMEVDLLSDGAGPPLVPVELPGALRFNRCGETDQNLGLATVDLRPAARTEASAGAEGLSYEVFASVRNGGPAARPVFVGLMRDGRLLAARQVSVPGKTDLPVVVQARLTPGPLTVKLLPVQAPPLDALAVDDEAYLLVPEEGGVAVGLVSAGESPALERALLAAGARLHRAAPDAFQDDPELRLVVVEGAGLPALPPRDGLFLAPQADVGPVKLGPLVERPRVGGWDRQDPLLAFVDPSDVQIERARGLVLGAGARALVQGEDPRTGEPVVLIASYRDGPWQRVVVGFDPYRSTWPLRASFPIFVRNCILAAARRDRLIQGGLTAGSPLEIPVAGDVAEVRVRAPDGSEVRVPAREGTATFAGTDQVGVYQVQAGERKLSFCVNLGAPEEIRVAPRDTLTLGDEEVRAQTGGAHRQTELVRWVALLALLALVVEAWIVHRRL